LTEHLLVGLASIIVLGITAQWLSWRLHLPAILLLLVFGIIAGPVTGVLNPDEIFGDLLFPLVSISIAIILFEGGLSLRISELRRVGNIVRNLTTVGIVVTWILAAVAAYVFVGIQPALAVLLGAILVVSGPTVIIPLLRQVKPVGNIGSIIKWEGIINDPIGAILAVIVFEVIISGGMRAGSSLAIFGVAKAVIFGGLIGLFGAFIMVLLLKRFLIPDFLQNPISLMIVIICYTASNVIQLESGLLAVTVMGIVLANQKLVSIKQITEFKENLRVLLISSLFIILASRLTLEQFSLFNTENWIFVGLLIIVVRPVAVFVSTLGLKLKRNERLFLAWMAPRGIVAAAVASVFAIRLVERGFSNCDFLAPLTFQVIIGTVAVYGLTASHVARWLKLARPNPQGVLFAGSQLWVQSIASLLKSEGFEVALVDSNWDNVTTARNAGLPAYYSNILSENLLYDVQLNGIGRLFAMTPNDEVNSLATLHFVDIFGTSEVYQLPFSTKSKVERREPQPMHLRGRYLFDKKATHDYLTSRFRAGAIVKKTLITEEFDYDSFYSMYGETALPIFIITESGTLKVCTADDPPSPNPGEKLISIVDEPEDVNNTPQYKNRQGKGQ
jgi:NhaP-type Na+/H+ or K+/H+ antiporter